MIAKAFMTSEGVTFHFFSGDTVNYEEYLGFKNAKTKGDVLEVIEQAKSDGCTKVIGQEFGL